VGDNDPDNVHGDVGQKGMILLAKQLSTEVQTATTSVPDMYKDMRQWYLKGAKKEEVIERTVLL
jgi:hypothetical protein